MIEIVVVIAHARHVQLLLFLFHQDVEEGNAGGGPGESGGPGGPGGAPKVRSNRNIKIIKEGKSCCDGGLVSPPPSFSSAISWG